MIALSTRQAESIVRAITYEGDLEPQKKIDCEEDHL